MKSLSEYEKEWKNTFDLHKCHPTPELISEWETEKKILEQHGQNIRGSYSVFDMSKVCIVLHLSARSKWLNPIIVQTDCAENYKVFLCATAPDDQKFCLETEIMGYDILMSLPLTEQKKFNMKYYRRFCNQSGEYIGCLLIIRVLKFDDVGNPWLIEIETERLPVKYHPEKTSFREFSHKLKGRREKPVLRHLSNKEKEITDMTNEGFTSEEIALKLDISISTVKNIRGNVCRKLNVNTTQMAYMVANKLKMF